jgi:flagellar capping protein FliD
MERKFKHGDHVIMVGDNDNAKKGMRGIVIYVKKCESGMPYAVKFHEGFTGHDCDGHIAKNRGQWVAESKIQLEAGSMEMKEIKKENIVEALKQANEEKMNAEIEFAKREYKSIIDSIDSLDRQIKSLIEQKKPFEEKLKAFK